MASNSKERLTKVETDGSFNRPVPTVSEPNNIYLKYVHLMPTDLHKDNIDALIICSPKDRQSAQNFTKHLSDDICFKCGHEVMQPKVKLFDGACEANSETLEKMLALTTYTFLFLTKSFVDEQWTSLVLQACMKKMLSEKTWSIIPVHTKLVNKRDYKVPFLLQPVKAIEYLRIDQFYKDAIINMFTAKVSERLKRQVDLNKKRRTYYLQNKERLIAMKNSRAGSPMQIAAGIGRIQIDGGGLSGMSQTVQHTSTIEVDSPMAASKSSFSQVPGSKRKESVCNTRPMSDSSFNNKSGSSGSSFALSDPCVFSHAGSRDSDVSSTSVCPTGTSFQHAGSGSDLNMSNKSVLICGNAGGERNSDLGDLRFSSSNSNSENLTSSLEFSSPCSSSQPQGTSPLSLNLTADYTTSNGGNRIPDSSRSRTVSSTRTVGSDPSCIRSVCSTNTVGNAKSSTHTAGSGDGNDWNNANSSAPIIIHQHFNINSVQNFINGDNGQIMVNRNQETGEEDEPFSRDPSSFEGERGNFSSSKNNSSLMPSEVGEALPDLMNPISLTSNDGLQWSPSYPS